MLLFITMQECSKSFLNCYFCGDFSIMVNKSLVAWFPILCFSQFLRIIVQVANLVSSSDKSLQIIFLEHFKHFIFCNLNNELRVVKNLFKWLYAVWILSIYCSNPNMSTFNISNKLKGFFNVCHYENVQVPFVHNAMYTPILVKVVEICQNRLAVYVWYLSIILTAMTAHCLTDKHFLFFFCLE